VPVERRTHRLGRLLLGVFLTFLGGALCARAQEPLPPGIEALPSDVLEPQAAAPAALTLDEVLASVERAYPLLAAAVQERRIAGGEQLSAAGAFDLRLDAFNETGALGFYQTNRARIAAEQPLQSGGKMLSGYRVGRGEFEPWYLERQTNLGGEFFAAASQPLLQNRAIDKRRAGVAKTTIARQAVEPDIDKQRIYFYLSASEKYWKWVATGHAHRIARGLLTIAQQRGAAIEQRVRAGDLPAIEQIDNERLIVSRQAKLIDADRKFRQAAVELSLFIRDETGQPIVVPAAQLAEFPEPSLPDEQQYRSDIDAALQIRPELRYLRLQRQKAAVDLTMARNQQLPSLDVGMLAAQDVGQQTPKGDKTPFQLEAGLYFGVPLQRRQATGQVRTSEGEMAQIAAKERYAADRVVADVQFAFTGLTTSYDELQQARRGVELARRMEQAERERFDRGDSNILFIQLREQATADAQLLVVEAIGEYHVAAAEYRAALGIDAQGGP